MATVSYNTMKEEVANLYSGPAWKDRVYNRMSESQIMAIYFKSLRKGLFTKKHKSEQKKVEKENTKYHQMNIFDWLKGDKDE